MHLTERSGSLKCGLGVRFVNKFHDDRERMFGDVGRCGERQKCLHGQRQNEMHNKATDSAGRLHQMSSTPKAYSRKMEAEHDGEQKRRRSQDTTLDPNKPSLKQVTALLANCDPLCSGNKGKRRPVIL